MWVRPLGWEENPWRRKWQPTPVSLPGESHGQRSLADYSPRCRKELDTTEQLPLPDFYEKHGSQVAGNIAPILQMRTQKVTNAELLTPSHTAGSAQQGCLDPSQLTANSSSHPFTVAGGAGGELWQTPRDPEWGPWAGRWVGDMFTEY